MRSGTSRGLLRLVVAALAAIAVVPAAPSRPVAAAVPFDLFISEYLDGPTGDAIEIFNGTGQAIDLGAGGYELVIYRDGSVIPSSAFFPTGTIPNGDVYVVAHPQASIEVLVLADQTTTQLAFTGNDAVLLRRSGPALVDLIGQIGVDPGPLGWGVGEVTTHGHDLVREPFITAGRIVNDAFDPATEWKSFPGMSTDFIGSHTVDTGGASGVAGVVDAVVTVPTSAACLELSTTSIEFGLVALGAVNAPAAPTIGVTNCSGSAGIVYARGTGATGQFSAWSLVDSPATCADALGIDAYHLRLAGPGSVQLSTQNKSLGSVASGATTNHTAHSDTACPGSTGGGTTMTFEILFLATEG